METSPDIAVRERVAALEARMTAAEQHTDRRLQAVESSLHAVETTLEGLRNKVGTMEVRLAFICGASGLAGNGLATLVQSLLGS